MQLNVIFSTLFIQPSDSDVKEDKKGEKGKDKEIELTTEQQIDECKALIRQAEVNRPTLKDTFINALGATCKQPDELISSHILDLFKLIQRKKASFTCNL